MSHFVFCVIYPIFPRNIIDVSHLHYFPLFMLQVQSDLSPVRNGSTVQLQTDYPERALGCQREQGKGQEYGSEGNQSCA